MPVFFRRGGMQSVAPCKTVGESGASCRIIFAVDEGTDDAFGPDGCRFVQGTFLKFPDELRQIVTDAGADL